MYCVQVHYLLYHGEERITRYLHFETYNSTINCIFCLNGREPGEYRPEDYFEAAKICREPKGEILNSESIETDWVLTYLQKTFD